MKLKTIGWLLYSEVLLVLREPAALFTSLILPMAVFLALGFSVGDTEIPVERADGATEIFYVRDVLLAGNIAWVTGMLGIIGLPQGLVEYRQYGVFRRYRVTPMPAFGLIVTQLLVGVTTAYVSLTLMLVVGQVVFGINFAGNAAMVALAVLVSYVSFAAIGAMLTSRIRNVKTALGLGFVVFAPMFVLSGSFGPRESFPSALQTVGDWLPLTHAYDVLTYLWLGAGWDTEATTGEPIWVSIAYLVAIGVVCVSVSVKAFRWE